MNLRTLNSSDYIHVGYLHLNRQGSLFYCEVELGDVLNSFDLFKFLFLSDVKNALILKSRLMLLLLSLKSASSSL